MTTPVTPVPLTPPRLGIIASAVEASAVGNLVADEHWIDGLEWTPEPCDPGLGFTFDPCTAGAFDSDPNASVRNHKPIGIGVGVECSTAGPFDEKDLRLRAERAIAAHEERLIGKELWDGTRAQAAAFTDNRYLRDANASLLSAASNPIFGLAQLEQHAADNSAGGRAYIHARPKLVTFWERYNLVRREGNLLLTAMDSIVVPSEGYLGTGPTGQTASDATHDWAYVTSPVELWRSEIEIIGPAGTQITSQNHQVVFASRMTAAIFDPCVHGAVLVTLS